MTVLEGGGPTGCPPQLQADAIMKSSTRFWGIVLALLSAMLSGYEALALLTPLPTISRLWQGLRDACGICTVLADGLAVVVGIALVGFAAWVVKHLITEHRSTL
jgi:hypothetical protein